MRSLLSAQAIQQLTKLAPATALLLKLDDAGAVVDEQEVPIALVQRGDRLKVNTRCQDRSEAINSGLSTVAYHQWGLYQLAGSLRAQAVD